MQQDSGLSFLTARREREERGQLEFARLRDARDNMRDAREALGGSSETASETGLLDAAKWA